jgi:hypothetical protein
VGTTLPRVISLVSGRPNTRPDRMDTSPLLVVAPQAVSSGQLRLIGAGVLAMLAVPLAVDLLMVVALPPSGSYSNREGAHPDFNVYRFYTG